MFRRPVKAFQIVLHLLRQVGPPHAAQRSLQGAQAVDSGRGVPSQDAGPCPFASHLLQLFQRIDAHVMQLLFHCFSYIRQF